MFWTGVELVGAALGVLIAAVVVLVAVAVVGFALMLVVAIPVAILQAIAETWRDTFGPEAELRRLRASLDAQDRALFEEALQEFQTDALDLDHVEEPEGEEARGASRGGYC